MGGADDGSLMDLDRDLQARLRLGEGPGGRGAGAPLGMGMGMGAGGVPAAGGGGMRGEAPLTKASSTRAYLETSVVPILREAMKQLARKRPADPYTFLIDFIDRNRPPAGA